ncbi:hypothetical protein GZ77_04495 [Endozoicomonas montiporae]|uniref:Uncharacterized protein n=1 Tax=Endozoicomonas montiporae TaxID=1027273 RepID=A0A081NBH6_9GAMM|nr:hypothetical protein GZ77_04495 [Endozoicomonas montiporae]
MAPVFGFLRSIIMVLCYKKHQKPEPFLSQLAKKLRRGSQKTTFQFVLLVFGEEIADIVTLKAIFKNTPPKMFKMGKPYIYPRFLSFGTAITMRNNSHQIRFHFACLRIHSNLK